MKLKPNKKNFGKWAHNTLIFLAPVGILYLVFAQANLQDGFDIKDLVPDREVIGGMILYVINTALDYLRKLK